MLGLEDLIIIIPVLFLSMSFHEAVHAFTAHWLGDPTARDLGRVSLNPFKHIDPFTTIALPVMLVLLKLPPILAAKPVPFNPNRVRYDEYGAALVGISGPFSNFLLALLGAGLLKLLEPSGMALDVLNVFVVLNVALFIFNMLPIPPLDGSRLLYAFAPEPLQRVMYQIESLGIFGIMFILIVLLPVIGPLIVEMNDTLIDFLGVNLNPV